MGLLAQLSGSMPSHAWPWAPSKNPDDNRGTASDRRSLLNVIQVIEPHQSETE